MHSTQLPTGASEEGVVSPKSLWHLPLPSQGEDRTGRKPARRICALSPQAPGGTVLCAKAVRPCCSLLRTTPPPAERATI